VADHQGPSSESRRQTPADVGDPSVQRVEGSVECYMNPSIPKTILCGGWPNAWWGFLLLPGHPARNRSQTEKAEALTDNLESQFQPVTDPSVPAVEMVDVALRSYFLTPASQHKLNTPDEVQEAVRGLNVSKYPGPNGIPKGPWSIYPSELYPSWPRFSMRFSSPITSLQCGRTLEWSLSLNRRRIQHCPHPIGPLVSLTRLINYLKRY
jgi:hypothetical protein